MDEPWRNCSLYEYNGPEIPFWPQDDGLRIEKCTIGNDQKCCEYFCMMSNSKQWNVSFCNVTLAPAYFNCLRTLSNTPTSQADLFKVFRGFQSTGNWATAITVACCALILLVSVCFKFYNQWAEQIILSKAVFLLGFGACLLVSFHNDGLCDLGLSVATTSAMFGDLLWTMFLVGKLVYTANRPFQHKSFANSIAGTWFFVCSLTLILGVGLRFVYRRGVTGSGYLQCASLLLTAMQYCNGSTGTCPCASSRAPSQK
jgi:hypothetical protein